MKHGDSFDSQSQSSQSNSNSSSPSKLKQKQKRSSISVDLGSSDWSSPSKLKQQIASTSHNHNQNQNNNINRNNNNKNNNHNNINNNDNNAPQSSLLSDMATETIGTQGLHHRRHYSQNSPGIDSNNNTTSNSNYNNPIPQQYSHAQPQHSTHHFRQRSTSFSLTSMHTMNAKQKSFTFKRIMQCLVLLVLMGYFSFLYLAHYRYSNGGSSKGQEYEGLGHEHFNGHANNNGGNNNLHGGNNDGQAIDDVHVGNNGHYEKQSSLHLLHGGSNSHHSSDTTSNNMAHTNNHAPSHPFAFNAVPSSSLLHQDQDANSHLDFLAKQSIPAFQRAMDWAQTHLETQMTLNNARKERRKGRTTPISVKSTLHQQQQQPQEHSSQQPPPPPHWYRLDHLSPDSIASMHKRWKSSNANDGGGGDASSSSTIERAAKEAQDIILESFPLCGSHAKEAALHYPQNYYPSSSSPSSSSSTSSSSSDPYNQHHHHHHPLGPSSRVLISGILSPLGLHLTLALIRQCNVTNFLGLDTEIPNDPLARLEQQERLAVLMAELDDVKQFKQLQVPFLGLEGKNNRMSLKHWQEGHAREERLGELFQLFKEGKNISEVVEGQPYTFDYGRAFQEFGIQLHPGVDPKGAGALDILLEYRPTHIVHLAGTQSDALLNPKNAPQLKMATRKEEEENDILAMSISSRPHLYEMRMGATGMEQLLAGVVAQTMLPPRYGRDLAEEGGGDGARASSGSSNSKPLSESDFNKMKKPHIVYASSYDAHYFSETSSRLNRNLDSSDGSGKNENSLGRNQHSFPDNHGPSRGLHGVSRLIDEILASTYYALHGISSVGLRLDTIYGPRGFGVPSTSVPIYNVNRIMRRGGVSADVDLAETAVRRLYRKWKGELKKMKEGEDNSDGADDIVVGGNLIEEAGWLHAAHDQRDFVYVEDAVGAIITAMQYRPTGDSPTTFNIGSGEMSSLSSLSEEIHNLTTDGNGISDVKSVISKSVIDVEQSNAARTASLDSKEYLRWSATTSLEDGAAKLLAWHLDRALPFFPPAPTPKEEEEDSSVVIPTPKPMDGEDVLSKRGIKSCAKNSNDPTCLVEAHSILPCASECSTKTCIPSVFDPVISLSRDVTEGCEVVLYTMSLGSDVTNLILETTYTDGEEQLAWQEPNVCTVAFIPSESTLAKNIIAKVPPASLTKMKLSAKSDLATKVKALSGHLVHQGWVLIFVDNAIEPLSVEDVFLPKIAPGRLFHPSVMRAMFVDENFAIRPSPEDAQFLTSEMSRGRVKKRTVMGPDAKGRKVKYKLPEEPQRRAVLLVAPMKDHPEEGYKINLKDVSKMMMKEIGLNPDDVEPKEIRVQREYYDRARSLINSFDLRSLAPVARHKIEIKDFIRSRWVIHDLKLEEGHQLRCEWYREHVKWNTHLDQLSFAYVMAKREFTRKIVTEQPLQSEAEKLTILQMIINIKSDAKEWHPMFSGEGTRLPIHHSQIAPEEVPQNLYDLPDNEVNEVNPDVAVNDESSNTYYLRIMSDPVMMDCRKKWTKARNERRKSIAWQRKKESGGK